MWGDRESRGSPSVHVELVDDDLRGRDRKGCGSPQWSGRSRGRGSPWGGIATSAAPPIDVDEEQEQDEDQAERHEDQAKLREEAKVDRSLKTKPVWGIAGPAAPPVRT